MNIGFLVFVFGLIHSLPSDAAWTNCTPVSQKITKSKTLRYQQDPEIFTKDTLIELHSHIGKSLRVPSSKRKQLTTFTQHFDVGLWTTKVNSILTFSAADAFQKAEVEYLFMSWIRERYLGNIKRTVRDRELQEVYKEKDEYSSKIKQHVVNNPAEPIVTGYSGFSCQSEEDFRSYTCADPHLTVHVQLSPQALCKKQNLAKSANLKVILHKLKSGFRIVDIEQNGQRIYQNAYRDFSKLTKKRSLNDVKHLLTQWSFTTPDELIQAELKSFSDLLQTAPQPNDPQNRLPANF